MWTCGNYILKEGGKGWTICEWLALLLLLVCVSTHFLISLLLSSCSSPFISPAFSLLIFLAPFFFVHLLSSVDPLLFPFTNNNNATTSIYSYYSAPMPSVWHYLTIVENGPVLFGLNCFLTPHPHPFPFLVESMALSLILFHDRIPIFVASLQLTIAPTTTTTKNALSSPWLLQTTTSTTICRKEEQSRPKNQVITRHSTNWRRDSCSR